MITTFKIDEVCEKHGTKKYSFGSGTVKLCNACSKEMLEAERQEEIKKANTLLREKQTTERNTLVRTNIGVVADFKLANYIYPPQIAEVIKRLIEMKPRQDKVKAFFTGAPKTGKTLTAGLITRAYGLSGASMKFISMEGFANIFFSSGFDRKTQLIRECELAQVLVIDDIEHCKWNENVQNALKAIIDYRDLHKPKSIMIITSNKNKTIRDIPIMNERRLSEFVTINFGPTPYPYENCDQPVLPELAKKILHKINELGEYTQRQAITELNINSPQQYFATLMKLNYISVKGIVTTENSRNYKIYEKKEKGI